MGLPRRLIQTIHYMKIPTHQLLDQIPSTPALQLQDQIPSTPALQDQIVDMGWTYAQDHFARVPRAPTTQNAKKSSTVARQVAAMDCPVCMGHVCNMYF